MKVVLFNGPPKSGKDTAVSACLKEFDKHYIHGEKQPEHAFGDWNPYVYKFAEPLKKAAISLIGGDPERSNIENQQYKNTPQEDFFGEVPRDVLISLSEYFAKPLWGNNFFGRVAVNRLRRFSELNPIGAAQTVVLISDCGFKEEVMPVREFVGADNVLLVRISRPDCNFDGDSRSYLHGLDVDTVAEYHNNGTKEQFESKVVEGVAKWLRT